MNRTGGPSPIAAEPITSSELVSSVSCKPVSRVLCQRIHTFLKSGTVTGGSVCEREEIWGE